MHSEQLQYQWLESSSFSLFTWKNALIAVCQNPVGMNRGTMGVEGIHDSRVRPANPNWPQLGLGEIGGEGGGILIL